jgi:hypothetical protein
MMSPEFYTGVNTIYNVGYYFKRWRQETPLRGVNTVNRVRMEEFKLRNSMGGGTMGIAPQITQINTEGWYGFRMGTPDRT